MSRPRLMKYGATHAVITSANHPGHLSSTCPDHTEQDGMNSKGTRSPELHPPELPGLGIQHTESTRTQTTKEPTTSHQLTKDERKATATAATAIAAESGSASTALAAWRALRDRSGAVPFRTPQRKGRERRRQRSRRDPVSRSPLFFTLCIHMQV